MSEAPAPHDPGPEAPAAAPRRREGRLARVMRGLLAAALGLVLLVVLVTGWLGGTQSGLQAVVDLAARLSGGVVSVEAPEGYLFGQLKVGALHVRTPTLQVDVRQLVIDWRPAALARGGLDMSTLSAAEVSVASTTSSTSPSAAASSPRITRATQPSRRRGAAAGASGPGSWGAGASLIP